MINLELARSRALVWRSQMRTCNLQLKLSKAIEEIFPNINIFGITGARSAKKNSILLGKEASMKTFEGIQEV